MPSSSSPPSVQRLQRMVSGLLLLLVVDVIWVTSSELTDYIFHDLAFEKPFFSTYFKTSLFAIYLVGFAVYQPWRDQCQQRIRRDRYQRVNASDDNEDANDNDSDAEVDPGQSVPPNPSLDQRSLSSPVLVPANIPESGKSSGAEESDVEASRRVRFKRVAQVVEMNPAEALHANLARLSYAASLRAQAAMERAAARMNVAEVMKVALMFCVPWFFGNFCYQEALSLTSPAVVNILSSSSCLFTLILASIFPSESSDRFTLSKFVAVLFSMIGVFLVSYSDLEIEGKFPAGAVWTLVGAMFYSLYIVMLRRKVPNEENMDTSMFFGFVGLFNVVLLWPGLLLLHVSHVEPFQIPTGKQLQFLFLNGIIGTVLSELLWLWGCFYTSSLVATLAISLTIPLSILADMLWKGKEYNALFFVGAAPMFVSFFIVAMLTHFQDWDPLLDVFVSVRDKFLGLCGLRDSPTPRNAYVFDRQEREALINQESSQDEL